MITLDEVSKSFAGRTLLSRVSLRLAPGERLGIVGANGAGKSTLFSLILGHEQPDSGAISRARGVTLGHLPQELLATPEATVLGTALRPSGRLATLEAELAELPEALARATDEHEQARLATRLAEAHALWDDLGGHDREARAMRVLAGLGFRPGDEHRPLRSFSGGYVMRAELARLLTDLPDLLLLDEPTNHLDLESVLWLQGFLASCPATLLVVSHDRAFLSATIGAVVEVDRGRVTRYVGDYEAYLRQRQALREQTEARARDQERRIRETERFIERFRSKATKARQVQSRIKALDREERIEVTRDAARVRFRFPQPERTSETVLELLDVDHAYGERPVYRGLDFTLRRGEKTVLVGPNGAGKSTLLKLLGGAVRPTAGERRVGHHVSVGYYTQHRHDMLDLSRSVLENAMGASRGHGATFVRTLLGAFLFQGDDVKKKASVLSGGEKSRLALALILLAPPSVLLMDEPTIHLDIPSVDALIAALEEYEGSLCFVSHDVHFIRRIARRVVRVEAGRVTDFAGDWDYYCWKRAHADEPQAVARGDGRLPDAGRAAEQAAAPTAAELAEGSAPSAADTGLAERSGRGLRAERRVAAEARAALARRLRPLREEAARLEAEIDELEREKAGLEGDLANPETYQGGSADIAGLRRRHAEVERRLAPLLDRWLEVEAEIEGAEQED